MLQMNSLIAFDTIYSSAEMERVTHNMKNLVIYKEHLFRRLLLHLCFKIICHIKAEVIINNITQNKKNKDDNNINLASEIYAYSAAK